MSKRNDDPLLDHEYDGIRELDNPMPGWWKATFFATFLFSIGYAAYYHGQPSKLIADEYAAEVQAYEAQQQKLALTATKPTEPMLLALGKDARAMTDAKAKFKTFCGPCHGERGEGKIGPNLTDEFWIHGDGTLVSIMDVVDQGVLAKGMPAWGRQLKPDELKKLVAFVGTVRNTHEAGGKKAEGQRVGAM
jgi:cytochrome c oxidase cbb3-type subunit 3